MLSVVSRTAVTSQEMTAELATLGFDPELTVARIAEMHACASISSISLWRLLRLCMHFRNPWAAFLVFHKTLTEGSYITTPGAVTDIVNAVRKLLNIRRGRSLDTADIYRLPWRQPIVVRGGRDRIIPVVSKPNMALITEAIYEGTLPEWKLRL